MITSALSLYKIFSAAAASKNGKEKFITVVATYLELEAEDVEVEALRVIRRLLRQVEADIESLELEEDMKVRLRGHVKPFRVFNNFIQLNSDIDSARKNFLQPAHLNGLTNLHLELMGKIERPLLDAKADELAQQFSDIRDEVLGAELPDSVKLAIVKRTDQIAAILRHYYAFGSRYLQDEIHGLVGALVVHRGEVTGKTQGLYGRLATLAAAGIGLLYAVDEGLTHTVSIVDNSSKIIELLDSEHKEDSE